MNAGDEMVRGLGDVLRPHFTERDYEQGCTLACGYDGDDRVEHLAHALAAHVLGLVTAGKAEALREAADEMDAVIADGDVAEVAAFVPGEVGRSEAVHRRDALYEEPATWLRLRADGLAGEAS